LDEVKTSVRVTSQFVGAAISRYGNAQDKKDWAGISFIQIQNDIIFGPSQMALGHDGPIWGIGVSDNPNIALPYQSYSDMARIMFHETHHMSHPQTFWGDVFGGHDRVDAWARYALKATGLDGNGCMAFKINNFPGC
jgi:hypothetical protein